MAEKIKTVIFDMDGVIFDTEKLCLVSWEYAAEQYKLENIADVFKRCIGTNHNMTRDIMFDTYGGEFPFEDFRKKAAEYFFEYERKHGVPLKPKVHDTMKWLKRNDYRIGLASSTAHATVERELREAGLFEYFDVIICGDAVGRSKPAPDIYIEACRAIGERTENCFAVEDSINGIISALDAGLKTIMVPDMLPCDERVKGRLFALCDDLGDVCGILEKYNY